MSTVSSDDVTALEPASDELHARRVELDEAISALVRVQREVQRTADAASLDLVKVDVALAALDDLRDKEVRAREKLADVRSELSGLRKVDANLSDASPLTSTRSCA